MYAAYICRRVLVCMRVWVRVRKRFGAEVISPWTRTTDEAAEERGEEGEKTPIWICSSALGIAQPLDCGNADAAVERGGAEWKALSHVVEHQITLDFVLHGHIKHVSRYVDTYPLVPCLCDAFAAQSAAASDVQDQVRRAFFRKGKKLQSTLRKC